MKRGRPIGSDIRQNVIEILQHMKRGNGYGIYKVYREIFPKITLRVIYYHLKKGVFLHEFAVEKVEKEKGDYSWGGEAEKIYYVLGKNAKPKGDSRVKEFYEKK
ncbi:hypothetical protein C4573_04315 [Candidatus Woesearchaeota archaeon]|nr:MAG: hypothetical protein C4573_04315 [Candidatus Woesearchaeota archaeon]